MRNSMKNEVSRMKTARGMGIMESLEGKILSEQQSTQGMDDRALESNDKARRAVRRRLLPTILGLVLSVIAALPFTTDTHAASTRQSLRAQSGQATKTG